MARSACAPRLWNNLGSYRNIIILNRKEKGTHCHVIALYQTRTGGCPALLHTWSGVSRSPRLYVASATRLGPGDNFSRPRTNVDGKEHSPTSFNPRAFQKCRQEYDNISYDSSPLPHPLSLEDALELLNRACAFRSGMNPEDVSASLGCLAHVAPEKRKRLHCDPRFSVLLRQSVDNVQHFSNQKLLDMLEALVRLDLPPVHGVFDVLEKELRMRLPHMELPHLLLAADLWRMLGRPSWGLLKEACNLTRQEMEVGPAHLVQLLYLLGEGRRQIPEPEAWLESLLLQHLPVLEPEELGAVCLGLFKSQTLLSDRTARRLGDHSLQVLPKFSDAALVNLLKLLRFQHLDHRGLLQALGTEVPPRAAHMGVPGLMHVALSCSALHHRDERVLEALAQQLPSLASQCRSKDAGKLLWSFGMLGFTPCLAPRLYPTLTKAMRLCLHEFRRFPQHLLTGLLGLVFVRMFPQDLLGLALSPEFVGLAKEHPLELRKDLFTLDASVSLEVPGWSGPRVDKAMMEEVRQQLWSHAQQDVCVKAEVLEAEELLQELLGGEAFVQKHMILPHTRSIDLEVRLDSFGRPLSFHSDKSNEDMVPIVGEGTKGRGMTDVFLTEDLLSQLTQGKSTVKWKDDYSELQQMLSGRYVKDIQGASMPLPGQRLALQVSSRNHYCYQSRHLLGLPALKRRQLPLVGCHPVELPPWEWLPLQQRPRAHRLTYLRNKIFGRGDCTPSRPYVCSSSMGLEL